MTRHPHRSPRGPAHSTAAALTVAAGLALAALAGAQAPAPTAGLPLAAEERVELLTALASDAPLAARVELLHDLAASDVGALAEVIEEVARLPYELPLRAAGVDLLSRLPAERSQPVLTELARHDPDPRVQALAAEALRVLRPPAPATFERLEAGLAEATDPADRRALASQLGALEDSRAQDLLWQIASDAAEHPMVAATAVEALWLPLDRPDLTARLEALLAEHLTRKTGSVTADAIHARLASSDVIVPGEIVD